MGAASACICHRGGLRASPPPAPELLPKEKPLGGRSIQQSQIDTNDNCTQPASPRHADFNRRRACTARPKGQYSRGRIALAPIRIREFSLPRGRVTRATPSFINLTFTSQHSLLWYFLGLQESTVTLLPPHAKTAARQYRAAAQCACVWLSSNTPWGR